MVADTPEKLDLDVDLSLVPEPQTRKDLEKLQSELAIDLSGDLTKFVVLARNGKIDFSAWKNEPLTDKQIQEIEKIFGKIASGKRLVQVLKGDDDEAYYGAKDILNKIVELMEAQEEHVESFRQEKDELKQDVTGDLLEGISNDLMKTISKHPWQSAAAGCIAAYSIWTLWHNENTSQFFQAGVKAGAVAWAINLISGSVSDDGRTLLQRGLDSFNKDKDLGGDLGQFLDEFKDDARVSTETLRNAFKLGNMPFDIFLQAYEDAKSSGRSQLSMSTLRRKANGMGIESDAFDDRHAEGLFALMQRMEGNAETKDGKTGVTALKELYGPAGEWKDFRFWQVVLVEGLDTVTDLLPGGDDRDSEDEESADEESDEPSSKKSKSKKKSSKKSSSEEEDSAEEESTTGKKTERVNRTPENFKTELATIPGFDAFAPTLEKPSKTDDDGRQSGDAELMGFSMDYERYERDDGKVEYRFVDPRDHSDVYFYVGKDHDRDASREAANNLRTHLQYQMQEAVKNDPVIRVVKNPADTLRWIEGQWQLEHRFNLPADLGPTAVQTAVIELRPNDAGGLETYHDGRRLSLTGTSAETTLQYVLIASGLVQSQPAFRGEFSPADVKITSIDPVGAAPRKISGKIIDSPIVFHWDTGSKTYVIDRFEISQGFIEQKIEKVEANGEFDQTFDQMTEHGAQLSIWSRGFSDVVGSWFESPTADNDRWKGIVEFKRNEILKQYRIRLGEIDPADPQALKAIEDAYKDTIGEALSQFEDYPARIGAAKLPLDEAELARLELELIHFGYSDAYRKEFDRYMETIGPGNVNYPGWNEDSNARQFKAVAFLQGEWNKKMGSIAHADFEVRDGNAYHDYAEYVRTSHAAIVSSANENPTSESTIGYYWELLVKNAVTLDELRALQPQFNKVLDWKKWKQDKHRDPESEAVLHHALPELRGHEENWKMEPVPGKPHEFDLIWYPGKTYQFKTRLSINSTTGVLEYKEFQLTRDWIEQHIGHIESSPEFSKPFDELAGQFDSANMDAAGFFPDIVQGWDDIEKNSWRAMVDYKRWEVVEDYRSDLTVLLNTPGLSPVDAARRFNDIHSKFTDRYLRDVHQMNARLSTAIRSAQQDSTTKITADEFSHFYTGLERLGYSDGYLPLMSSARGYYERFPYGGSWMVVSPEWRTPTDGVNAFMKLIETKTAFMNNPIKVITDNERAYFYAVRDEVDGVARRAYANQNGTGNAGRASIGPDEIENTVLSIPDYAEWAAANPTAGVPIVPPMSPTPPAAPGVALNIAQIAWAGLQHAYKTHWYDKVYDSSGNVLDGVDDENVEAVQKLIEEAQVVYFKNMTIVDPAHPQKHLDDYTKDLDKHFEVAKAGWWEFWE